MQNTGAKMISETDKKTIVEGEAAAENNLTSELSEPRWSVVSFDAVAVSGLPYEEARNWLEKLGKQNIAGLCIVTDEAAARMTKPEN
jgi:hypothetical protein